MGCLGVPIRSKDNWFIGTQSLSVNPYDEHTLRDALHQAVKLTRSIQGNAYCECGYKRAPQIMGGQPFLD